MTLRVEVTTEYLIRRTPEGTPRPYEVLDPDGSRIALADGEQHGVDIIRDVLSESLGTEQFDFMEIKDTAI